MLVSGAELDGPGGVFQPQGAAAHQIQQVVADGGVGQLRADGAGHRAAAVAQQHKGGLAHGGRHVTDRIVRLPHRQRQLGAAGSRLHHIAGKAVEQAGRRDDLAGADRVGVGLGAKVKGGLAVLQRPQQRPHQPAGRLVSGHQQAALFQQGVQRSLGQAGLAGGIQGVAKAGGQFLRPLVAVFVGHCLRGGGRLHADGKLAVPLQQAQAGTAVRLRLAQDGGDLGRCQAEHAQDAQLCGHHGNTSGWLWLGPPRRRRPAQGTDSQKRADARRQGDTFLPCVRCPARPGRPGSGPPAGPGHPAGAGPAPCGAAGPARTAPPACG